MTQLTLGPKPHNNHYLFSDYYLDNRVQERREWRETDVRSAFSTLAGLWHERKAALINTKEAQTEDDWIRPVLRELGHYFTVQVSIQVQGGSKTPDYFLCPDEATRVGIQNKAGVSNEADLAGALAVADAKAWERPLDRTLAASDVKTLHEHPGLQIDTYIRHSGLDWGVLTNGRLWRLYHKDSSKKLDVFYEIDLPALLEAGDVESFKYFWLFFRREAFMGEALQAGHPAWLQLVRAESESYERGVSESLKKQVYDALQALAQGFFDYPANGLDTDPATLKAVYDNSLIVLYRLLFIFYAEARDLLPVRTNETYRETYSLLAMKKRVANDIDRHHPAAPSMDSLWGDLGNLWRVIDSGDSFLGVPAYNGGLFKPGNHPFLQQFRVGDSHLRTAIDLLARIRDARTGKAEFVDYRDLEIRHLGSIYEGLLEYNVQVEGGGAPGDGAQGAEASGGGEVSLLNDKGERKATGSYYTPDYIVQYIVEHTVGPVLAETAAPYLDAEGGVSDAAGLEKAVLAINVLDPAMGSGHFLVAAADFIARFLVERNLGGEDPNSQFAIHDSQSDLAYWRRRVAQACIYGVDLNPLAVELAKLSLWLATVSKDKPLSFLDHHLRCGNSLIGARVADLPLQGPPPKKQSASYKRKEREAAAAGQLSMLDDTAFAGSMRTATGMMGLIESLGSDTLADVQQAETVYRDTVRAVTQKARLLADLWTARHFGLDIPDDQWQPLTNYLLHGSMLVMPGWDALIAWGQKIAGERRFFHWELEFPEVFFDEHGRLQSESAGFDAVIGNPPYLLLQPQNIQPDLLGYFRTFVIAQYKVDVYHLFIQKGIELLAENAYISLITPSPFLTNNYTDALRNFILETTRILNLTVIPDGIFQEASVDNVIFVFSSCSNKSLRDENHVEVVRARARVNSFDVHSSGHLRQGSFRSTPGQIFLLDTQRQFWERRLASSIALRQIAGVNFGMQLRDRREFPNDVIETDDPSTLLNDYRPCYTGRDVSRYALDYGNLYAYFNEEARRGGSWNPLVHFADEKLIVRQIGEKPDVAYDSGKYCCLNTVFMVTLHLTEYSLKYILATLNSQLISSYWRATFSDHKHTFPKIKGTYLLELPIRRIAFTTSAEERERLVEQGRQLYADFLAVSPPASSPPASSPLLTFTSAQLAADPERSDVIHDLLAFLAERMIELNKERQKLERALDPFKWLDRGAVCKPFTQVFAEAIKYGELVGEPDLGSVRHDVEGLRLLPTGDGRSELQVYLKHRDPATDWARSQYDEDGNIVRTWAAVYRFDLAPGLAQFYTHALPLLDQFTHAKKFPGGKTKNTLQKLHAGTLPLCDPAIDLTPLEELTAELTAVRSQIARTDTLIDQIVYRLYGLTEEEVAIVEGRG